MPVSHEPTERRTLMNRKEATAEAEKYNRDMGRFRDRQALRAHALHEPAGPSGSLRCDGVVGQKRPKKDEWSRGYYCAIAMMLKRNYAEGVSGPDTGELFRSGGDWRQADPEDIETFRRHGLLPNKVDMPTCGK